MRLLYRRVIWMLLAAACTGDLLMSSTASVLEAFVFHPDQFTNDLVPRRLNTTEVVQFIDTKIDGATPVASMLQAEKLVDFYDLGETAPNFERLLDRHETSPADLMRSTIATRVTARVGAPRDRDIARQYYVFLTQRAETPTLLNALASVYEALGAEGDARPLFTAITQRLNALRPLAKADPNLTHDVAELERLASFTLPRLKYASEEKERILAIQDRPRRLDQEIDIYLTLKPGYPETLPAWASRRLRRETWARQPAQQTVRTFDPALRMELALSFRMAMQRVEGSPGRTPEEKKALDAYCLHAIGFFEGELSPPEKESIQRPGFQFFVLSNE